jgi:hypothetical protein
MCVIEVYGFMSYKSNPQYTRIKYTAIGEIFVTSALLHVPRRHEGKLEAVARLLGARGRVESHSQQSVTAVP